MANNAQSDALRLVAAGKSVRCRAVRFLWAERRNYRAGLHYERSREILVADCPDKPVITITVRSRSRFELTS
jgi:hypothetical protein